MNMNTLKKTKKKESVTVLNRCESNNKQFLIGRR